MISFKKVFAIIIVTSIILAIWITSLRFTTSSKSTVAANNQTIEKTSNCKIGLFAKGKCKPLAPGEEETETKPNVLSDMIKHDEPTPNTTPKPVKKLAEPDTETTETVSNISNKEFLEDQLLIEFSDALVNTKIDKEYASDKELTLRDLENSSAEEFFSSILDEYDIDIVIKMDQDDYFKSIDKYYLIQFKDSVDIEKVITICDKFKNDYVKSCEKIYTTTPLGKPNDTLLNNQANNWHIKMLNLENAWKMTIGKNEIKIGVLDNGFETEHEDLKENIAKTIGKNTNKNLEHGTAVLGLIAAKGNNGFGTSGAMRDASIYTFTNSSDIITFYKMIKNAIENNIRVINLPFTYSHSIKNGFINKLVKEANQQGIVFVTATANCEKCNQDVSPQDFEEVIVVNSIDNNLKFVSNKNTNFNFVSAPGINLTTTKINNLYYESNQNKGFTGSSGASALVTGVIGLMLSVNENLTETQIKSILYNTSQDLSDKTFDSNYGQGIVDACMAVYCSINDNLKSCFNPNGYLNIDQGNTICARTDIDNFKKSVDKKTYPVTPAPVSAPFPIQNPNTNPIKPTITPSPITSPTLPIIGGSISIPLPKL